MNVKRIKCILTGGCRFKGGTTECYIDDNDMVTIKETCYKCGKEFSFTVPYAKFEGACDKYHSENELLT